MGSRDQQLMKEQLAALVEAYAAARLSQNRILLEHAAGLLNEFLAAAEISSKPTMTGGSDDVEKV
jgi:hypothetical protein